MDRPIIGILAQEVKPWDPYSKTYKSYIAASYVKAVESSGARVVPIFVNKEHEYYKEMALKLNGFLYPGGASDVTSEEGYARSGKIVYDTIMEMNKNGDAVPILGVCLGMELLANIAAGGIDLRTPCSSKNEALNLDFLPRYRKSSLFSEASDKDLEILSGNKSTSNHHRYCITRESLSQNEQDQWVILSTSTSIAGEEFVSSMEMVDSPIAAIIFHPEKSAYEWKPSQANPHDSKSIAASRIFYDWLVGKSRCNSHKFDSEAEEHQHLIYNYMPTYTGKDNLYDTQCYYFSFETMKE